MPIAGIPGWVKERLAPHEIVRWMGRPSPVHYAVTNTWSQFLFGGVWTAMSTQAFFHESEWKAGWIVSVAFTLIGFAMLLSPIVSFFGARATLYVVTTNRALIFGGLLRRSFTSITPADLGALELVSSAGNRGTVVLNRNWSYENSGEGMGWVKRTISFVAISDAAAAFAALEQLKGPLVAPT